MKAKAIMVDIDGTVALRGDRSPYDESTVGEDQPNLPVIAAVKAMFLTGHEVVFCSGRTEACRLQTEMWLDHHVPVAFAELHMRQVGDQRKDALIKREIYEQKIRDRYDVLFVLDDRQQVVDMWRELGLTVFQVAKGDF